MAERYLIDSNVIIDFIASLLPEKGSDFVEHVFNSDFLISAIVKIEVLGFDDVPGKLRILEEFVNSATILPLNETVIEKTIHLKRIHKKLKLGDAIIASTAIVYDLTLISRNITDFAVVKGLKILNPWKLS